MLLVEILLLYVPPVLTVTAGLIVMTQAVAPRLPRSVGAGAVVLGLVAIPLVIQWNSQGAWDSGDSDTGIADAAPVLWLATVALVVTWIAIAVAWAIRRD